MEGLKKTWLLQISHIIPTAMGVRQIAVTGILLVFLRDLEPLWQGKIIAAKAPSYQGFINLINAITNPHKSKTKCNLSYTLCY